MIPYGLLPGLALPAPRIAAKKKKGAAPEYAGHAESEQWPPVHEMMRSLLMVELKPQEALTQKPAALTVLGVGLAHTLCPKQQHEVAAAHIIAGGRALLHKIFPQWETWTGMNKEFYCLDSPLAPTLQYLVEQHHAGRRVLVLADGDPLFFGIGATLLRYIDAACVRILPAVSSLQHACARAGLPWHNTRCISLHGRENWRSLYALLNGEHPVCILTDAHSTPDIIAKNLLDRGVDWFSLHIFENMEQSQERVYSLALHEAASIEDFDAASTVLLYPIAPARRPVLGIAEAELAVEQNLITKAPIRAAALSLLRIMPQHTVWDIGAGSGAMALEVCTLAHQGCVVAVEKCPHRALGIQENRRRFGAAVMEIHIGSAPQCCTQLPPPHRIFVGGGVNAADGQEMLASLCQHLVPGGRVVVSGVLMKTVQRVLEFFQHEQWQVNVSHIQAAHSVPLAGDIRLQPINPVFLICATKPKE